MEGVSRTTSPFGAVTRAKTSSETTAPGSGVEICSAVALGRTVAVIVGRGEVAVRVTGVDVGAIRVGSGVSTRIGVCSRLTISQH